MPPPANAPRVDQLLAVAAQCLRLGRPADALTAFREAAWLQPDNAVILHDLGIACLQCGQTGEAIDALRQCISINPLFADAHLRLGIAYEAAGSVDAALAAYRRANDVLPSLADARYRAGELLDSLGQTAPAVQAYRRAAASAPRSILGRIATAKALVAENRDAEAEKTLRQALALDKANATAMEMLGNLYADAGRFDEARGYLLRAIAQAPLLAGSYYDVVRCRRIDAGDGALIADMRHALGTPGLEPAQRSRLHLALAKAADDLGDYEEAMRHCDAAETLRNSIVRFDLPAFQARVQRLMTCITPELLAQEFLAQEFLAPACGPGRADPAPVLIVGLPRSGTTLVEQILSAHRDVSAGGELSFWNELGQAWEMAAAAAAPPSADQLSEAAASYLRVLRGISPASMRVTDKMPLNFQWAGFIHAALPRATIIHCRRNPIDTALSIHQTHFNPRIAFPTGGAALVGYVRGYQALCAHWRRVLPAEQFIEVDYEALTAEPEPEIRRMVTACGLDWDPACLRPEDNARVVRTPSKWQARQPVYRTNVGRWRRYESYLGALRALDAKTAVLF